MEHPLAALVSKRMRRLALVAMCAMAATSHADATPTVLELLTGLDAKIGAPTYVPEADDWVIENHGQIWSLIPNAGIISAQAQVVTNIPQTRRDYLYTADLHGGTQIFRLRDTLAVSRLTNPVPSNAWAFDFALKVDTTPVGMTVPSFDATYFSDPLLNAGGENHLIVLRNNSPNGVAAEYLLFWEDQPLTSASDLLDTVIDLRNAQAVPEPMTMTLFASGLLGL